MRFTTRAILLFLLILIPTPLVGCANDSETTQGAGGPLEIEMGSGAVGINAPPGNLPWQAYFGGILTCSKSDDLVISRVEFLGAANGQSIRSVMRHVSAEQVRNGATLIYSALDSEMAEYAQPDEFRPTEGSSPQVGCPRPDISKDAFDEIFVVFDVDSSGNSIDGLRIHYESHGKSFHEDVNWKMEACARFKASICAPS